MANKYLSRRARVLNQTTNPDGSFTYGVEISGSEPKLITPLHTGSIYGKPFWFQEIPTVKISIKSTDPDLLDQIIYLMWE